MKESVVNGLIVLGGYFIGSIPFGLILSHLFGAGDIRKIGSGNIGATNVLRSGKKTAAILTLLLDAFKGYVAVIIGKQYGLGEWMALAAALGHIFPIWLKFKGGKGVATYAGVLLALSVPLFLQTLCIWLGVALVSRYSSLGALVASMAAPLNAYIWGDNQLVLLTFLLAMLIWIRHAGNIKRLLNGTESRIKLSKGKNKKG